MELPSILTPAGSLARHNQVKYDMTILVIGATGHVGQHVSRQLIAAGDTPRVLLRDVEKIRNLLPQGGYEFAKGDFFDSDALDAAMEGVEAAFMLTVDAYADDLTYAQNIVNSARKMGVKRIVLLSCPRADSSSDVPFTRWHGEAEDMVRASGLQYVFLRPDWFMDNFQYYVINGELAMPFGTGRNSFVAAEDIAAVAVVALKDAKFAGRTLSITGPEAFDHEQVVSVISEVTGKSCTYKDLTPDEFTERKLAEGWPEETIDQYIQITQYMRDGEIWGPTTDVQEVTGRSPKTLKNFFVDNKAHFTAACG